MNTRICGKIGMLIIFVGFFMPASCNMSGFDVVRASINPENRMDMVLEYPEITMLLIVLLFISASIGSILLVLLVAEKKVNHTVDNAVTAMTVATTAVICFLLRDHLENSMQIGAWVIIVGAIIVLIFFLIDSNKPKDAV
jgi:hypothetical protein